MADTECTPPKPGSAIFEGKTPKEIRAILKSDQPLTAEETWSAFNWAYPDFDLNDPEQEADARDDRWPRATLDLIEEREAARIAGAVENERLRRLDTIRNAATCLSSQGFDPTILSDDDLEKIGEEMRTQVGFMLDHEGRTVDVGDLTVGDAILSLDEDTGAYTTPGGVIVGYRAEGEQDVEGLLRMAGERIAGADARLAGEERAKQVWLDRVNAAHDPKINKLKRLSAWLRATYLPLATSHIDALNERLPEGKRKRSLQVGLLRIQMGKTVPSVVVEDDAKVIAALRALAADPDSGITPEMAEGFVNRKETVAKSAFTAGDKAALTAAQLPGLTFKPGGEDTYVLK